MLLVLHRSGRTTAQALADRLEVSERTILRDVEALGAAGIPIFTTRGSNGGIELMDRFQTHLTGLTTDEGACLFLIGQPLVVALEYTLLALRICHCADGVERLGSEAD